LKDRKKIKVVGHGIDTEKFIFSNKNTKIRNLPSYLLDEFHQLKINETLIKAVEILVKQKER